MNTTLSLIEHLGKLDIFRGLNPEKMASFSSQVVVRRFPPGTVLYRPEEWGRAIFALLEGQVDIYRLTSGGSRLIIRRVPPGGIFGEIALPESSRQRSFAQAVDHSLICIVSRERMFKVMQEHPDVALRVLHTTYDQLEQLEERLEQASFSPVRVRLAHFLLANLDPLTGVVAGFTQADIGDTIGALRQTVTETLTELRGLGAVEVGHKRIRVLDVEYLEELVNGHEVVWSQTSSRNGPGKPVRD